MRQVTEKEKTVEELFKENYSRAFYYALDFVNDEEVAKDIVGDCFSEIWNQYNRLQYVDLKPYLFRMVRNRSLNVLKHRAVEADYRKEMALKMELIKEDNEQHEALLKKVTDTLNGLNPQTRRVIDLCYFQGKKYAEAGETLGISPNTVHKHISKAMSCLRKALFNIKK